MNGLQRVLVVDDQQDIRLMCRLSLALEGYQVLEADEGERALAVVRQTHPDLVLLDVMMPGVDGWRVLETMKADPDFAWIPVVMLTARAQREDELRGRTAGASAYLAKPFNPSTLTEVVHRVLSGASDDRREHAIRKLQIL